MDSNSGSNVFWKWENIKGLFSRSVRIFFSALPLFVLWLMIPFVLLILNSWYQSGRFSSERNDQRRFEEVFHFKGENSEILRLHVSYPIKLRIDPDELYDDSITIWLTGSNIQLPQEQLPPSYTFLLRIVNESADFIDEEGRSIPGVVTLFPALDNDASEILYLKSNPVAVKEDENIEISLYQASPNKFSRRISIPVEAPIQSELRHFSDAIFSLPTLIGGLLTAIAGFGLQQWKEMNSEEQRKRDEEEKLKQSINDEAYRSIGELLEKSDYPQAFERYRKYSQDVKKTNPRVDTLFEDKISQAIKREFDRRNFFEAISLYLLIRQANIESLKATWEYQKSIKLSDLLIHDKPKAKKLIDELTKHSLVSPGELELYKDLGKGVAFVKLSQLLKPWSEIIMEGDGFFQKEHADIRQGMNFMRIDANPFGFEKTEKDLRFNDRFDKVILKRDLILEEESILAIFEDMNSIYPAPIEPALGQSQIIVGSKGSGKTAMALLVAGLSFFLKVKTIPVYCKIYPGDKVENLLYKIVMSILNYYVINSIEFLALDISRQSAFAALVANYIAVGPELSFRLKLAGLASDPLSVEFQDRLLELTASAKLLKLPLKDIAPSLLEACPSEYKRMVLLFDCQDSMAKPLGVNSGTMQFLSDLQQECVIKIFSSSRAFSGNYISRLNLPVIKIVWSKEMLKNVLKSRMDNIQLGGVGAFFDPSLSQVAQDLMLKGVNTPGDLIHSGNEVLKYIGRNNKRVGMDGAKLIFGASLVKRVLKESQKA